MSGIGYTTPPHSPLSYDDGVSPLGPNSPQSNRDHEIFVVPPPESPLSQTLFSQFSEISHSSNENSQYQFSQDFDEEKQKEETLTTPFTELIEEEKEEQETLQKINEKRSIRSERMLEAAQIFEAEIMKQMKIQSRGAMETGDGDGAMETGDGDGAMETGHGEYALVFDDSAVKSDVGTSPEPGAVKMEVDDSAVEMEVDNGFIGEDDDMYETCFKNIETASQNYFDNPDYENKKDELISKIEDQLSKYDNSKYFLKFFYDKYKKYTIKTLPPDKEALFLGVLENASNLLSSSTTSPVVEGKRSRSETVIDDVNQFYIEDDDVYYMNDKGALLLLPFKILEKIDDDYLIIYIGKFGRIKGKEWVAETIDRDTKTFTAKLSNLIFSSYSDYGRNGNVMYKFSVTREDNLTVLFISKLYTSDEVEHGEDQSAYDEEKQTVSSSSTSSSHADYLNLREKEMANFIKKRREEIEITTQAKKSKKGKVKQENILTEQEEVEIEKIVEKKLMKEFARRAKKEEAILSRLYYTNDIDDVCITVMLNVVQSIQDGESFNPFSNKKSSSSENNSIAKRIFSNMAENNKSQDKEIFRVPKFLRKKNTNIRKINPEYIRKIIETDGGVIVRNHVKLLDVMKENMNTCVDLTHDNNRIEETELKDSIHERIVGSLQYYLEDFEGSAVFDQEEKFIQALYLKIVKDKSNVEDNFMALQSAIAFIKNLRFREQVLKKTQDIKDIYKDITTLSDFIRVYQLDHFEDNCGVAFMNTFKGRIEERVKKIDNQASVGIILNNAGTFTPEILADRLGLAESNLLDYGFTYVDLDGKQQVAVTDTISSRADAGTKGVGAFNTIQVPVSTVDVWEATEEEKAKMGNNIIVKYELIRINRISSFEMFNGKVVFQHCIHGFRLSRKDGTVQEEYRNEGIPLFEIHEEKASEEKASLMPLQITLAAVAQNILKSQIEQKLPLKSSHGLILLGDKARGDYAQMEDYYFELKIRPEGGENFPRCVWWLDERPEDKNSVKMQAEKDKYSKLKETMIQNCQGLLIGKVNIAFENNDFFSVHNDLMDIYYDKLLEKQRKKKMSAETMDEVTMDKDMSQLIECIKAHQTFIGMDTLGLLNNDRPAAGIKIRDPSNKKFDDTFRFDMLRHSGKWGSYYDPDPNADPMHVNFHPYFLCNKPPNNKPNPIQHLIGLSKKSLDDVDDMEIQSQAPSEYSQNSTFSINTASVLGKYINNNSLFLDYFSRKKPPQQSSSTPPPPPPPQQSSTLPPPPQRKRSSEEYEGDKEEKRIKYSKSDNNIQFGGNKRKTIKKRRSKNTKKKQKKQAKKQNKTKQTRKNKTRKSKH